MPMLKKDKEKMEAARAEWEKKFKAIFFHMSPSITQDFAIVKLCTLREYAVEKLKDIINDVKNELIPLDDKAIYQTFCLLNRVRTCTMDVIEGISKWQQAFTYIINPPLMQCDYIMERIVKHITFVNSTSLRRVYNFQFMHRGNFLMLPFPNPRTTPPLKITKELFKELQEFAYPDEERVVNCYKTLVNCLPDEAFAKLMPMEQWLVAQWTPCVYIGAKEKEVKEKKPKFKLSADGTLTEVGKKEKKFERIDNGPFFSSGGYRNDELPRLIGPDESMDIDYARKATPDQLKKRSKSASPGKKRAPSSLAATRYVEGTSRGSSRASSRSRSPGLRSRTPSPKKKTMEELLATSDSIEDSVEDTSTSKRVTISETATGDRLPTIETPGSKKNKKNKKERTSATAATTTTTAATSETDGILTSESSSISKERKNGQRKLFLLQLPYTEKNDDICSSPEMKFRFVDTKKKELFPVAVTAPPPPPPAEEDEGGESNNKLQLGVIKAVSIAKITSPKRRARDKNENIDGTAKFLNPFFELRKKTELFSGSREKAPEELSIEEKAKKASVSTVAIRNWFINAAP